MSANTAAPCPLAKRSASRLRARFIAIRSWSCSDEPNSNLDAEGDESLTRAILGLRARGAIVIVVAHRPSAIAGVAGRRFQREEGATSDRRRGRRGARP